MTEISTPRPRTNRRGLLFGGIAAAATATATAAVAAGALVAPGGDSVTPDNVRPMAAGEVLTKASDAAAAEADLKPKPGQYLYYKSQSMQGGKTEIRRIWLSVDGKHATRLDNGWICSNARGADIGGTDLAHPPTNCHDQPAYDFSIPTNPKAAKTWLYKHSYGSNPPDVQAFITVGDTIRERYIGSKSLAAIFKAAAQIPGVKVYRNVTDSAGRTGIAVGQTWRYSRAELIFDPKTFKLIGERYVCDTDTSFHPAGAAKTDMPDRVWCKNGQVGYSTSVLAFGLVNRPGQLP